MANKLVFTMKGLIVLNGKEIGTYRREYSARTPHGGQRLTGIALRFHDDETIYGVFLMKEARQMVLDRLRAGSLGRLASQGIAA